MAAYCLIAKKRFSISFALCLQNGVGFLDTSVSVMQQNSDVLLNTYMYLAQVNLQHMN